MTDDDLFLKLKGKFQTDQAAGADWNSEARLDYAFEAGDQWDAEVKARFRDMRRPCITFNRIQPTISAVVGMEVSNRQEVRFLPRTTQQADTGAPMPQPGTPIAPPQPVPGADDTGPAEVLTGAAIFFRDQCDAEDEESDMFRDVAIAGMGWTHTRVVYDKDPDGTISIDRVDPFEMVWDCKARKRNLADRRHNFRVKLLELSEAKKLFPDADENELDAGWADPMQQHRNETYDEEAYISRGYENEPTKALEGPKNTVRVVECEWFEDENTWAVVDPVNGAVQELDGKQYRAAKANAKKSGIELQAAQRTKRVYKTADLGAAGILKMGLSQSQAGFAYQCVTGFRDRNKNQWYGVVRNMRGPQQWANTLVSSVLHTIQSSGKGVMIEADAVENIQKFEEEFAKVDKVTTLLPGGAQKITPKPQSVMPQGTTELMQFSLNSLREVTGVNVETLGLADRQQAASLESQRRQAATTMLASLFDGLRRYRKDQGRVMLNLIQEYCSDDRLVRIVGPDGEKYAPLAKDAAQTKYDIIVDDAPNSPNQKEATWSIIEKLIPVFLKMPLPPEAFKAIARQSPLPSSFVQEFFKPLTEAQKQPPQPDPAMMMEMQAKQAEIALKEQDLKIKEADIAARTQVEMAKIADGKEAREHDAKMQAAGFIAQRRFPEPQLQGQGDDAIAQAVLALAQQTAKTNEMLAAMMGQQGAMQ